MIRFSVLGRAAAALALILTLGAASANAASITFTLGGGGGLGSVGNQRTFAGGGVTVYATAWYNTGGDLLKAALGQWSTGLGVCNSGEESGDDTPFNNCGSPLHTVDNAYQDDFVLFLFDKSVDVTSVYLEEYGDTDVSYWRGTVSGLASQTNLLGGINFSELAGLGLGARVDDNNGAQSSRTVTLSSPLDSYNALLIGATLSSQYDDNDRFKIKRLTIDYTPEVPFTPTPVPEPGTIALFGLGLVGVATAVRRRRQG